MMKTPHFVTVAWLAVIAPAFTQTPAPAPAAFEEGVRFHAADLLPADSLRGPSFRVRDQVVTDGFMAHFEIDTDFGLFTAGGVPQVRTRAVEAEAIRKLVDTSKSDLFAEGLKRSIETPIDAVKNIVTKPVETVQQVPKTVGHFFGKIGSSIGRGVNKIKEETSGEAPAPTAGEVAGGIGETAKNVAGFDKAKLDTAKQLGVDPYSDNARLQQEMNKVTWAFFAGGLPLRIGAAVASAGVAVAATNMVGVPADIYALTQSELAHRDQTALETMGVSVEDIDAFMIQPSLSTTRRHRIVTAISGMSKTGGRGFIIRLANSCTTPAQADFMINALDILVARQRAGEADYASLQVIGRLPAAMTAAGELQVPAPVDYVTWTEQVAGFAQRDDLGTAPKVLVHTGRLSEAAAAGFKAAGWQAVAIAYPAP
jgi:hypothetical protein